MKRESMRATAVAHPNIALAKYWGKRPGTGNFPAVPSLSVTLTGMSTRTSVDFRRDLSEDRFVLGGVEVAGEPYLRVRRLLERVRRAAGVGFAGEVISTNDFPTASGLASSASGFAALALAACGAAGLDWDRTQVSDLARRSSASAARSLFGGFVELDAGPEFPMESQLLGARPLLPSEHMDLRVLVCVTTEGEKALGSTGGMQRTAADSPYYGAWLETAPVLYGELRTALLAGDLAKVGFLTERSALAMHASALAAGVVYVTGATLDVLAAVRALRRDGRVAYATMDAGPHVKVLTSGREAGLLVKTLRGVPGVLRVLETAPGDGAQLIEEAL